MSILVPYKWLIETLQFFIKLFLTITKGLKAKLLIVLLLQDMSQFSRK